MKKERKSKYSSLTQQDIEIKRLLNSAKMDKNGVKNVLSITTVVEDSGPPTSTITTSSPPVREEDKEALPTSPPLKTVDLNQTSAVLVMAMDLDDQSSIEEDPAIQLEPPARQFLGHLTKKGAAQKFYAPLNLEDVKIMTHFLTLART